MPYSKDSPPERIKGLPAHAQEIWIAAFNAALKEYNDEGKANATAWAAVEKAGYKKDGDGKWHKAATESDACFAAAQKKRLVPVGLAAAGVRDSALLLADEAGRNWRLPFVGDAERGFAFGVLEALPDSESKPFDSKPMADVFDMAVIEAESEPDKRDFTVTLIRSGDNATKKRRYTAEAIESAAERYNDVPMYLDHEISGASKRRERGDVRSIRDMAAKVLKTWVHKTQEGASEVRAKIHVFDDWLAKRLVDPVFKAAAGLSHDADVKGRTQRIGGKPWDVVESVPNVRSVDFVTRAAFGGGVIESQPGEIDNRLEDLTMLDTLTEKDLREKRPDLVAVFEAAGAETAREESQDEKLKADLAAKTAENVSLQQQLRTTRVREAVAEYVAKPESGVVAEARAPLIDRVTVEVAAKNVEGDALATAVQESVKAQLDFARTAVGTARPGPGAGEGRKPSDENTDRGKALGGISQSIAAGRNW